MGPNKHQHNKKHAKIQPDKTGPGLVAFMTFGQETERVYSYNPGARE